MAGYVGDRAKKRKRKYIAFYVLLIIFIILFYFFYKDNELQENKNNIVDDNIELQTNIISIEEYELQIIDKDQKIAFRNQQIESLLKENKKLSESIKFLNSKIEKILKDSENIALEKIKELNLQVKNLQKKLQQLDSLNIQLNNEILEIKKDYKTISNLNLKTNFQIDLLEEERNDLEIKNNILMERVQYLEQLKLKYDKIIANLEDKIHH